MKVIHLGKYYYPEKGGIETYIQSLVENVPVKQEVIVSNTNTRTSEELIGKAKVTRLARLFKMFSLDFNLGLVSKIQKSKADIYHLHMPNPMAELAFLIARPYGRLVVTWHSDVVRQKMFMPFYKIIIRKILDKADKIIVTSPQYLESSIYLKDYRQKCIVIPLAIDFSKFEKTESICDNISLIRKDFKRKIVLFVGRLVYYKGLEYLIDAVRDIDVDLLVIGEGPLRNKLEKISSKNVHFLGNVKDTLPYYHACDVFVLPSIERSEAFGLVQLEAIACRKPVISTKLGTGVEFVNKFGTKVTPKNILTLRKAILNTLNANNSNVIERNYSFAKNKFDIKKIAEKIKQLYLKI